MDAGNQRQAGEVWSPELGLLVTWTKARAEKAVWRKRGSCGFVPNSLFHMGPNSSGSVHWLWGKRALGLPNHCTTSCHVHNQRLLITLGLATVLINSGEQASTGPRRLLILTELHNLTGFPLTHSPAHFWFTLLLSGDAGVCRAAELALWFQATAWQIFFLKFFLTEIQVYCWKSKICI